MKKITVFLLSLFFTFIIAGTSFATAVDLELALLVDASGSVSSREFNLHKRGYVDAFNNNAIWTAIDNGSIGSIAASLIYWSGSKRQQTAVDWTLIDSLAAMNDFADSIELTTRPFSGMTAIGSALQYGADQFSNSFEGSRNVIDISGDGVSNSGLWASSGRNYALANGIDTINGMAIGGHQYVYNYYNNRVIGGTNAFVMAVNDFTDFGAAIDDKLVREIVSPVPEPATIGLLGIGLIGIAGMRRKESKS